MLLAVVYACLGNMGLKLIMLRVLVSMTKFDIVTHAEVFDAFDSLGQTKDPRAVDFFIAELQKNDSTARCAAAIGLGEARAARAVAPLLEATRRPDSPFATQCAFEALGKIGDPSAVVQSNLSSPRLRAVQIVSPPHPRWAESEIPAQWNLSSPSLGIDLSSLRMARTRWRRPWRWGIWARPRCRSCPPP